MFPEKLNSILREDKAIFSSSQGSDSGVSISFPAVAGVQWGISKILLNTDTASEGWIERPIGTVQWRFKLPANVAPFMLEDYGLTNANQGFAVIISQSTTKCYANIKAYSIS